MFLDYNSGNIRVFCRVRPLSQTELNFGTLDQYIVSIDSIEKQTGLDLFSNLYGNWEREIKVEKEKNVSKNEWPFNPYWYQKRIEDQ